MKDKLLKIINHYGVNHQLRKFQEEVFELNEAIITYENDESGYSYGIRDIAEEIADCYVILEQFRHYYNITNKELVEIMNYKTDRQLKRIEDEDKI